MNSLLNMKIVNDKPLTSEMNSNVVVDEETQEEDPNFVYEEDEPKIKEVISEVDSEEKKPLLNVVKKPPIVKEAIFDETPKKKKWSEEKKKKKQQKTKEPEMTQEEIDSYAPEEGFKEESDDEPIIPETKDIGGLDVKEPEPEPQLEPTPSEPVAKKRKPKKPMTEEHKRKVQEGLKKAREIKKRNAELRRQKGIKTKTELKKEKKELQMKLLEQEHAELQKQKKQLKPTPEPTPEPVKSEPKPPPSEPIENPKRDYITREDLEQAQLNTLATYEMMRKKRKEEKRKQQAIKEYQDNLKETINNINNQPQMGWLKGAKKYGRYL